MKNTLEIDWNHKGIVVENIEYKMYVLNSGYHDEKKFKGTVIYSKKNDSIGDVRAFKKKLFKHVDKNLTITFKRT